METNPELEIKNEEPKKEMETDHPLLQKKELTLKDYKNLRRMYFTVRRATVSECGRKYDDMNQPRTNWKRLAPVPFLRMSTPSPAEVTTERYC